MMLLMGMCMSLTKNPMKPMIANPIAVAMAIFWNSFLSGLVHLFTSRIESFTNCRLGSTNCIIWSMAAVCYLSEKRSIRSDRDVDAASWRQCDELAVTTFSFSKHEHQTSDACSTLRINLLHRYLLHSFSVVYIILILIKSCIVNYLAAVPNVNQHILSI